MLWLFSVIPNLRFMSGELMPLYQQEFKRRQNIISKLANLEALDHAMYKSVLRLMLHFIPVSIDKSFVRANVYYTVSDSVF